MNSCALTACRWPASGRWRRLEQRCLRESRNKWVVFNMIIYYRWSIPSPASHRDIGCLIHLTAPPCRCPGPHPNPPIPAKYFSFRVLSVYRPWPGYGPVSAGEFMQVLSRTTLAIAASVDIPRAGIISFCSGSGKGAANGLTSPSRAGRRPSLYLSKYYCF